MQSKSLERVGRLEREAPSAQFAHADAAEFGEEPGALGTGREELDEGFK